MASNPPPSQAGYQVRLFDTNGLQIAVLDTWKSLNVQRRVNTSDTIQLAIDGADPRVALFGTDYILEVWRKIDRTNSLWYPESVGFVRDPQLEITQNNDHVYTVTAVGLVDLIRRRELAYYANTAFTLKGGAGETVIKQFVNENAGPGANNAARLSNGVTSGLNIEGDLLRGLQWAGQVSWQNLLGIIQNIATLTNVDFDVVRTDNRNGTGVTFEFRCYYPQLGTDRTATVAFAPELGNMATPKYAKVYSQEINRVIVLGAGTDDSRRVIVRDGIDQALSPWNIIEQSLNDSKDDTLLALQATGDAKLLASKPPETFTFNVLQGLLQYGADYFLGDKVTAGFDNISTTKKITGVVINVASGRETISLEFADYPIKVTGPFAGVYGRQGGWRAG